MLLIVVEHFLTADGKYYFPEWIEQVHEKLKAFDGFLSIEIIQDVEVTSRDLLLMRFENMELLRQWSNSQVHADMLTMLRPYMMKRQKSQIFKSE